MAADLAGSPITGVTVQACGDMHLLNFGAFASAERKLVFGINDFDETMPGAWEWDLKRLAASATLAVRHIGGDRVAEEEGARAIVAAYRQRIRQYARHSYLRLWYETLTADDVLPTFSRQAQARVQARFAKAKRRNHMQVLEKMTDLVDDRHQIVESRPLIVRETHTATGRPVREALGMFLEAYLKSLSPDRQQLLARYRVADVARKIVGVGSVGTRCWVVYLEGASEADPMFLQIKEAQRSVLEPYFSPTPELSHGQRVVIGQRLTQGSPDIFLGWGELDGTHFYVRQLRDMKGSAEIVASETKLSDLIEYCGLCGWALALAHAKSGDAAAIAGYAGKTDALDSAVAKFAVSYADLNDRDFDRMQKAVQTGRLASSEA